MPVRSVLVIGYLSQIPFRFQLVMQLGLLFLAFVGYAIGVRGNANATDVEQEESGLRQSKTELQAAVQRFESSLVQSGCAEDASLKWMQRIKDDARFLSPTNDPNDLELDDEIRVTLQEAARVSDTRNADTIKSELPHLLERCGELMRLRRKV